MKLEPAIKINKRNKATSKKFAYVMSASCNVIVIFPIYGQFGAIEQSGSQIPDA